MTPKSYGKAGPIHSFSNLGASTPILCPGVWNGIKCSFLYDSKAFTKGILS